MRFSEFEPSGQSPTIAEFDSTYRQDAISVFDFDGVLSSPCEDAVYKLTEKHRERDMLVKPASYYGINPTLYDVQYLRHLVLQAILEDRKSTPEPGPVLELARAISKARRPFFVLTARSGQAAIRRALVFLDQNQLTPQEIFFVGRVPKGRQLSLIRETAGPSPVIVYFEDSLRHALNSRKQMVQKLNTVRVLPERSYLNDAELLLAKALEWFDQKRGSRRAA